MVVLDRAWSALLINAVWLVCCLPVVTIGAATGACYATASKRMASRDCPIWSTFFRAFKENLRQTTVLGLFGLPPVAAGLVTASYAVASGEVFAYAALVAEAVMCACVYFWCVPLALRFDNTTMNHLRNGLALGLAHLGSTFVLALGLLLIALTFVLLPPVILFLPIVTMLLWSSRLEKVLRRQGYIAQSV